LPPHWPRWAFYQIFPNIEDSMKILLTGGGTGGHFYPIIAVVRALKKIAEEEAFINMELIYFSDRPFDANMLREEGVRFVSIASGKMRRYFSFLNFIDFFKTIWGIFQAIIAIYADMPDVVFAKGGYVSFPALFAAKLFRIPVIIHESDITPGFVNSWAAKFAKRIAISFPESIKYFPESKTALVGNPVRLRILGGNPDEAKEIFGMGGAPAILALGGSQGAQKINNVILDILPELLAEAGIIHQCGQKNLDSVSKQSLVILEKSEFKERYRLYGFINEDDLRSASSIASLIISRAGAGAIFEIAAWGKPSILIPIADSAQDHQRQNAYAYARTGAAAVIEEINLTPHILISEIKKILSDEGRRIGMKKAAAEFAKVDAAEKIARQIVDLALEHAL
jgi:UDP-N-acetylglucosamine--N-acetylmuramyl-(pentapeptide) pyrophosphoryl-undecaprenol N-acetylglucosamine transferase